MAVQRGSGAGYVDAGMTRPAVAQAAEALTNSETDLTIDVITAAVARRIERHYIQMGAEIMFVQAIANDNLTLTIVRGARGTDAMAHNDNAGVNLADAPFAGLSVLDKTLRPEQDDEYDEGDVASILTKGDIWVEVAAAVSAGDPVVAHEGTGALSSQVENATRTSVPNAIFMTDAPAGGLAIVRLHEAPPTLAR